MTFPYFVISALRKSLFPAKPEPVTAEEAFEPFDLSQLRHLPRDPDLQIALEAHRTRAHTPNCPSVHPPAVPFNFPNA